MNKEFEKWVKKQVDYYKPFLDINLQDIKVEYKKEQAYIGITCTYPYLEPTILYSDKAVEYWKNKELTKDKILHELCHIITDPFYIKAISRYASKDGVEDERERLTDTIAVILNNLIK